jgi:hypothetical protein
METQADSESILTWRLAWGPWSAWLSSLSKSTIYDNRQTISRGCTLVDILIPRFFSSRLALCLGCDCFRAGSVSLNQPVFVWRVVGWTWSSSLSRECEIDASCVKADLQRKTNPGGKRVKMFAFFHADSKPILRDAVGTCSVAFSRRRYEL